MDAAANAAASCVGHGRSSARRARLRLGLSMLLLPLCVIGSGCSSLLPRASNATSSFRDFEDLRDTVQSLQPMKTTLADLVQLGLGPDKLPNTAILTHVDILQRFVPGPAVRREDLDPGILACLQVRDACRGWALDVAYIKRDRTGGFLADFLNFRRRTETTGWRFNALILLANDVVVYRVWGGQPLVNQSDVQTNPLGPLQEIGPAVVVRP